jgi:hypothetical protein
LNHHVRGRRSGGLETVDAFANVSVLMEELTCVHISHRNPRFHPEPAPPLRCNRLQLGNTFVLARASRKHVSNGNFAQSSHPQGNVKPAIPQRPRIAGLKAM